jgi:hypothetical protein
MFMLSKGNCQLNQDAIVLHMVGRSDWGPNRKKETWMIAALLGWLGTAGTFAAYAMLWRGHLESTSIRYAALNVVGGLLGGLGSAFYGAWPSVASNLVWAALGLHSVVSSRLEPRVEAAEDRSESPAPCVSVG